MTKYFKVKENTDAWKRFNDLWTWEDKWVENKKEIEEFLGFDYDKNLYLDADTLTIEPKMLPDKWKNQFKKNSFPAVAKKNSVINKEWVSLCKSLGLAVYRSTTHISFPLDVYGKISTLFPPIRNEFYFEAKDKEIDWSEYDWTEEVRESDFLRIRADWLEEKEKRKLQIVSQ